ncbi:MAG: heme exporter protein CcmD [Pseudomonadota bacterium]
MPELGKYADAVLSAYALSIGLLVAIVAFSVWRSRRIKAQLAEVEARRNG